jgi:hypothetical protein
MKQVQKKHEEIIRISEQSPNYYNAGLNNYYCLMRACAEMQEARAEKAEAEREAQSLLIQDLLDEQKDMRLSISHKTDLSDYWKIKYEELKAEVERLKSYDHVRSIMVFYINREREGDEHTQLDDIVREWKAQKEGE